MDPFCELLSALAGQVNHPVLLFQKAGYEEYDLPWQYHNVIIFSFQSIVVKVKRSLLFVLAAK